MSNFLKSVTLHRKNILIIVLCVALGYSLYLLSTRAQLGSNISSEFPLINPSYSVIDHKNLVVNFQDPREYLQNTYTEHKDLRVSLYFEYLNTGSNISINKDDKMWPASLIKIPVAMAALKKVEEKQWKLSNELVILDEDKDSSYGTLYKEPTGTTMTVEKFIYESIVNSDNTAHFVLLRNLESEEIEDLYNHLGLDSIIEDIKKRQGNFEDNKITTKNYSIFFRALYNSTYLNPHYSNYMLDMLTNGPKNYLGQGISEATKFAHKSGIRTDVNVLADSGIVYDNNRPYLITVMIQKKNPDIEDQKVFDAFKDISKVVYEYVQRAE